MEAVSKRKRGDEGEGGDGGEAGPSKKKEKGDEEEAPHRMAEVVLDKEDLEVHGARGDRC